MGGGGSTRGGFEKFLTTTGLQSERGGVAFTEEEYNKLTEEQRKALPKVLRSAFEKNIPEVPTEEEADRIRARAIAERLRKALLTGKGRASTIATSARGVLEPVKTQRRELRGA